MLWVARPIYFHGREYRPPAMKERYLLIIIALYASLAVSNAAAEVVYRWVDTTGNVHFSDQPQTDNAEVMEFPSETHYPGRKRPSPDPAKSADNDKEKSAAAAGDTAVDPAEEKRIREANCKIARQNLEGNQNIGRMYRVGSNGERVYLSESERSAVIKKSQGDVSKWCD
jgi:hypothetical protein